MKALIKYQCWTTIKPLLGFYSILYGIVILGYILGHLMTGGLLKSPFSGIEISCFIYLGITGSLGFSEDFKMAIQNSFTRKQTLLAALSMFLFVTCIMSIIDTLGALCIQQFSPLYRSLFQQIYPLDFSILAQWLSLFLVYFTIIICSYLLNLICNKLGKKVFYFLLISVGLIIFALLPMIITLCLPQNTINEIVKTLGILFGYLPNGTIELLNPFLLISSIIVIITSLSYVTIKKTELN